MRFTKYAAWLAFWRWGLWRAFLFWRWRMWRWRPSTPRFVSDVAFSTTHYMPTALLLALAITLPFAVYVIGTNYIPPDPLTVILWNFLAPVCTVMFEFALLFFYWRTAYVQVLDMHNDYFEITSASRRSLWDLPDLFWWDIIGGTGMYIRDKRDAGDGNGNDAGRPFNPYPWANEKDIVLSHAFYEMMNTWEIRVLFEKARNRLLPVQIEAGIVIALVAVMFLMLGEMNN